MTRRRRIALGVAGALALLAAAAAVVLSRGTWATFPRSALMSSQQQHRAPGWTAPCWPTAEYTDNDQCVHVHGRVVWVQKHDPDGDGDRHLVVVARLHVRIVKIARELPVSVLPHVGQTIDAVGWLIVGASGRDELHAQRLAWSGQAAVTPNGAVNSPLRVPAVS